MALIKCKECGKEVSSNAKTCPNCGNKMPKKTSIATWIIGGVFLFVVVTCTLNVEKAKDAGEARIAAMTPEQRAAEEKTKKDLSDLHDAQLTCEGEVKKTLHDPDSAQFDDFRGYAVLPHTAPPDHYIVLVTVRAKNGFGALRHIAIRCDLSRKNGSPWTYTLKETT
jgi:hypothetical protein